uniref:Peptidase S1 domain-containing protein n=2 Tax=Cacopsylla melanoneura TaxID=428564 RepID=A0A8D8Z651_9HEMI
MNFDMFDAQHAVQQCKIVGFGILKFPRAGYFNLLTWLQPMTRWEREVTVKNGCMGKPAEWNKKKWNAMSYGSLCSTVFSSEARVCWNDRGAALVCNGFLAGMVQAQFEDEGKLDLTLRQCADMDIPSAPRKERYQVIFFNMKFVAELIPEQMARTQDLEWSKYYFNRKDLGFDLNVTEPEDTTSTETDPTTATVKEVYIQPKPIQLLASEKKSKGPRKKPASDLPPEQESTQNESERVPRKRKTKTPSTTTAAMFTPEQALRFKETPELEMNLRTQSDQDEEVFNTVIVDDVFNENHPFAKSTTNVLHLAILLNNHTQQACTAVFITPQSVLTAASCLVRKEDNYQLVEFSNYKIITGHSNGLIDYCSDRIRMYAVQNISLLDQGLRQPWQVYKRSRILPYTEIFNLAVLTIAGSYLSNTSYPTIDYDTWCSPARPLPRNPLIEDTSEDSVAQIDNSTMQCTMLGYGHMNYPYTNQRDRIGIKFLDLEITENCSRPFFDYPFGEQSENLWIDLESQHFFCAVNLNSSIGPSTGSIGSPLYCGQNMVGLYIGRYNNHSFDSSSTVKHNPSGMYTHVFLKLDHYNDWITDVLLDETVVQMRLARLPPSQARPTRLISMMYIITCVIGGVTLVYVNV